MRTVVSFEFVFSATHLQIQKQRTAADVTDFESQVSPTKTITVRPPKRNLRALEYEDDPGLEYVPSDGEGLFAFQTTSVVAREVINLLL